MKKNHLLSLIQDLFPSKKLLVSQETERGDNIIKDNEIANTIHKTVNNNFELKVEGNQQLREAYESVINPNSSIQLRETILPIEDLINEGKFTLAINKYDQLINSPSFSNYSRNEMFSILIGMLNCHINNKSTEDAINFWSHKILALGKDIEEIYRYYYLMGIKEYGKDNYELALIYLRQAIDAKPDYLNAVTGELLVSVTLGQISYEESVEKINELLKKPLGVKDFANVHANFGDIAFKSKDFKTAKGQYFKSNTYLRGLSKEIGIAICQYFISFEEFSEDGIIELDKIDFTKMAEAEVMFDKIYEARDKDTIETIINLSFSVYLSVLELMGKNKKIVELYNENIQFSNLLSDESINFIVEAQILNSIKDDTLFSKLDEYHQIKYEVFYFEKRKEYDKVVELLTPIFESKYKDEKVLKLTFLVALKELNQFENFMEYYQRFSAHEDEVMRINYIQFLMDRGETKEAIREAKELSKIARNGFVLYDLMFFFINNDLNEDLNEFFANVNSGRYRIIGIHKSSVFFQMMIHLLNQKEYEEFFKVYESTNLSFLEAKHRLILKINYNIFKNDFDELASAYYEFFQISNDYNDLMKAVQVQLQVSGYHKAEFYLSLVQPMELDNPEYYYMFHAMILKEKNQLDKAFEELDFVIENIELNLESSFHQFYTAFNMNNNRAEVAFKYMGEYYSKNPNPKWFKVIQHLDSDTGEEILAKLEEAVGGRRDLTLFNNYFSDGLIGISVYNKIVGQGIEDIINMSHYPFTKKSISRGDIQEIKSKVEFIRNEIIVDTTTLIILSSVNSIDLLNIFEQIIIPTSTMIHLNEIKSGIFSLNAKKVLEYLIKSPKIKMLPVDEAIRSKEKRDEVFHDDTQDCITLSRTLNIPFLNTEVFVSQQYKLNEIIDINTLFFFFKENNPELRRQVALTIAQMRDLGFGFLSFDSEDMFILYKERGIDGINPFLEMCKNADYKTFSSAYTLFLKSVLDSCPINEFEVCSIKVIKFMDKYIGKTRYYSSSIIRQYPSLTELFDELVKKPSASKIMTMKAMMESFSVSTDSGQAVRTYEFNKIFEIASSFMIFVFQYISIAIDSADMKAKCVELLKNNVSYNSECDIDYILNYMNLMIEENKRKT
ncbi:tetratricopeptide repeat protein [Aminipila sp.]|uniref:tetratricopeptide repeat protein n=1 Tax=Aminipila sp. TaxID=2060095 RepID=UPI00289BFF86|nr:hypothetical protein [Aminipila sp.]